MMPLPVTHLQRPNVYRALVPPVAPLPVAPPRLQAFGAAPQADPLPGLRPTHAVLEVGSSSLKLATGALNAQGQPVVLSSNDVGLPTSKPVPVASKVTAFEGALNTLVGSYTHQFPNVSLSSLSLVVLATGPFRDAPFMQEVGSQFNNSLQQVVPNAAIQPISGRQEGAYYFRSASEGFLSKHPEARLPGTKLLGMDMGGFSTELVVGTVPKNGKDKKHQVPAVPAQRLASAQLGRFNHALGNQSTSFDYATLKRIRQGVKQQLLAAMTQDKQHWWEHLPFIGNQLALRNYQHPDFMFSGSSVLRKDLAPLIHDDYAVNLGMVPVTRAMLKHYLSSQKEIDHLQVYAQQKDAEYINEGGKYPKFQSLATEIALVEGVLEAVGAPAIYVSNYGNVRKGALLTQLEASESQPAKTTFAAMA